MDNRHKAIVSMLGDNRIMFMTRMNVKRTFASKWKQNTAPRIVKKFKKNKLWSYKWRMEHNGKEYEIVKGDVRHLVNVVHERCTYRA